MTSSSAGEGNDVLNGGAGSDMISAGNGDDEIAASSGHDRIHGGDGNDHIDAGSGSDNVACGLGDDRVDGHTGDDEIDAGPGSDDVRGGGGDDLLIGGPGRDLVHAGAGADRVVILDVCELAVGEVYDGGSGIDTLVTPVDLATLAVLSVDVQDFETIEVDPTLGLLSACGGCGCAVVGSEIKCCSGHGQCGMAVNGGLVCNCDTDFAGDDCSIECDGGSGCVSQTYRSGDGAILGISMAGAVLFSATDPAAALASLRAFVAEHPTLFKLAPSRPPIWPRSTTSRRWSSPG
jgi:Ca2+-binding RTX toxin-like protein